MTSGLELSRRGFLKECLLGAGILLLSPQSIYRHAPEKILRERKPILNPDLKGDFSTMSLPKELMPQKELWRKIFTEYDYKDAVLYNPQTFEVYTTLEMNKRGEKTTQQQRASLEKKVREYRAKKIQVRVQRGQKDETELGVERAYPYWNHCLRAFANNGVAPRMALMAFLETSFNKDAVSPSEAVGAYQFLEETGKSFLMISDEREGYAIDERLDPIREAEATALLLRALYARYGDELIALNAFHSGKGNLDRAKVFAQQYDNESGQEKIRTIIEIYSKQTTPITFRNNGKKEKTTVRGTYQFISSQYVPGFFGVKEGLEQILEHSLMQKSELEFDTIELKYLADKRIDVEEVMSKLGVGLDEMIILNPAILYLRKKQSSLWAKQAKQDREKQQPLSLRRFMSQNQTNKISKLLPEGYRIRVPKDKGAEFMQAFNEYLCPEVQVEKSRKSDPILLVKKATKGGALYHEIIKMRAQGRAHEITLDMLKKVRIAYYSDLIDAPDDPWTHNSIKVIEYDIKELKAEQAQAYWEQLQDYARIITGHVSRLRVPSN